MVQGGNRGRPIAQDRSLPDHIHPTLALLFHRRFAQFRSIRSLANDTLAGEAQPAERQVLKFGADFFGRSTSGLQRAAACPERLGERRHHAAAGMARSSD